MRLFPLPLPPFLLEALVWAAAWAAAASLASASAMCRDRSCASAHFSSSILISSDFDRPVTSLSAIPLAARIAFISLIDREAQDFSSYFRLHTLRLYELPSTKICCRWSASASLASALLGAVRTTPRFPLKSSLLSPWRTTREPMGNEVMTGCDCYLLRYCVLFRFGLGK